MKMIDRLKHAWNIFNDDSRNQTLSFPTTHVIGAHKPLHSVSGTYAQKKSVLTPIKNRIAIDCSMVDIVHVIKDPISQNEDLQKSGINNCLTVEANIDQSGRDLLFDIVYSMLDEQSGAVAVVPVETSARPIKEGGGYDIITLRTAKIVEWFPKKVKVNLYNEETGKRQDIILDKSYVAIIENPFNELFSSTNMTASRLLEKINILDKNDREVLNSQWNMLFQLPYDAKTDAKKKAIKEKIKDLEESLSKSRFGIGYIEASDKVIQINRPVTDGVWDQIKKLSDDLNSQFGITPNVINGSASASEMLTYMTRTVDPIIDRIIREFQRKFLTKNARTRGHMFVARKDPFKMLPIDQFGTLADILMRNSVVTPNEVRAKIGLPPSIDPSADLLMNRNINPDPGLAGEEPTDEISEDTQIYEEEMEDEV